MFREPESSLTTAWLLSTFETSFHLSGTYELPFGKGKPFLANRRNH